MPAFWRSPAVKLTAYFVVLAGLLALVWELFPGIRSYVHDSGVGSDTVRQLDDAIDASRARYGEEDSLFRYGVLSALAVLATLLFSPPIAWIYMVTKRQEGYDRTFVQVLIMLPIVVAAVVRVVRGDLALAFALAGIVAAVRFRTTLKDLKNAVFAFATIGIGLAAGTGNWLLAGQFTLIFCLATYALWVLDIGGVGEMLTPVAKPMRLSEALVPGVTQRSVVAGSRDYARHLEGEELDRTTGHARLLARLVNADALRSKRKYDTLLIVYTKEPAAVPDTLAKPFERFTTRHDLVDTLAGPNQSAALAYLLRLEKKADVGEFLDELGCHEDDVIKAAEIKSVKGLRKQIT